MVGVPNYYNTFVMFVTGKEMYETKQVEKIYLPNLAVEVSTRETTDLKNGSVFDGQGSAAQTSYINGSPALGDFGIFMDSLMRGELKEKGEDIWTYTKHYTFSYIRRLDFKTNSATLKVVYPQIFEERVQRIEIDCKDYLTAIVSSENLIPLKDSVSFFSEAQIGDGFYFYCLNEECISAGKSCILVRN